MSNSINPYDASRPELRQRSVLPGDFDEETSHPESKTTDPARQRSQASPDASTSLAGRETVDSAPASITPDVDEAIGHRFGTTLEGAIERTEVQPSEATRAGNQPPKLEGLSSDEQNMIYRYFPESPTLALKLYKPDLSTNKVDPGSVGSRVDLRG